MNLRSISLGIAVVSASLLSAAPMASAAASPAAGAGTASDVTSTISNASTSSCVDVPGGSTNINTDLVSSACTGAAEQTFSFRPVAGEPAGTYNIVNAASGLCMVPSRFAVAQFDCLSTNPEPTSYMWTLLPVHGTTDEYTFVPTGQVSLQTYRVIDAVPASSTFPTPELALDWFSAGDAQQEFTVAGLS